MKFKKFLRKYKDEYERELKELCEKDPRYKVLIPEGLGKELIQQYTAYRIVEMNRWLVWVTCFLVIVTIISAVISWFIR